MSERIVVLKEYGNNVCLIAVAGRCEWTPDAQVRLAKRVKRHDGTHYDPLSFDRSPAFQEVEKSLRGLGLNVCRA